jgi:AraC family transcriptional regulator
MSDRMRTSEDLLTVDAQYESDVTTVQVVRYHLSEPIDDLMHSGRGYRLDLSVTPRPLNSRARFVDRWRAQRFERVGPVFLLREGERVHARSDSGQGAAIVCRLQTEPLRSWFDGDLQWTDQRLEASLDISCGSIKNLLLRMGGEVRDPGFAHSILVDSMATQLAVELQRYCTTIDPRADRAGLARWRLRLIDERLAGSYVHPTLAELAALCKLSVRQLTRGFRASRGGSIGSYIAERRLDHAKRLLVEGQCIKVIAGSMGFSSPSSFCYSFRRATGLTPGQFRDRSSGIGK